MNEPQITQSDAELRSHVARVLDATYELDREIGRGGMGIVYRARDRRLKRPVAIKLLPPELAFRSEIRSRFLKEAETAAQLSHPSIVPIYSVDEKDGLVYFVMAFVDGDNIAKRIHDKGPIPAGEARRILREVADALAFAHANGVVHRDIKPDNIILDATTGRPMVTDFGIARAISDGADARLTATGIAIGTPAFMSPEQSAGDRDLDGRSDLYSLGIVAYQMLCGELPFVANNTPALLVKHLSERPVPIDQRKLDVPPDLARAVMLCLEKNPEDRFADAAAMVKALDSGDVPALPPPRPLTMQNQAMPATGGYRAPAVQDPMGDYVPTAADIERWNAPEVVRFRRKVTPFMFVGGACMVLALVSDTNFMGMWGLYGVYLAYQYARLWSDGYDWHDVFRQPRDRIFTDVMAERLDEVQAMWDTRKRGIVRERHRRTLGQPSMFSPVPQMGLSGGPSSMSAADAGALGSGQNAAVARQAIVDREEIARLLESLSKSDRARFPDVIPTAQSLAQKVLALATALTELERASGADSAEKIDKEISLLESQANPLDRVASEERVRRLALLKRQRRTVADVGRRKAELQGKIESCSLMLENLKLDLLRFKTGQQPWQTVTSVTERAQSLARDVDNAVYVADEMNRLSPRGGGGRTRADTDRP